jgi:hypothetical protein
MVDEIKPVHPVPLRPKWPFTRRQIVAQIVVAAVILVSGIAIGTGGTILTLKDKIMWRPPVPPGRAGGIRGPFGPGWIVKEWTTQYALTAEQVRQVEETLTKQFEATRALWVEFAERDKAERGKLVEAMRSILTPEQFGPWEREFKRRTEHFDHWRPGGPGGPGGPDRMRKPDHQGGPNRPGGADGHRDRGFRDMKGLERPPEGLPPDGPAPDSPPPDSSSPQ